MADCLWFRVAVGFGTSSAYPRASCRFFSFFDADIYRVHSDLSLLIIVTLFSSLFPVFSSSSLHDRFIGFISRSSKKGLCRWKSNEVHATHIRAKVEESEQQNERAQVANHQRGKRYEIDSVVATTFQTTPLVRYSCRYAVRTILKTGVFASRVELVREVTSTAPS